MTDLASALASQFGDGEPRELVAVDPGRFTIRAYRYAGGMIHGQLDPLRGVLCDPCSTLLELSIIEERASLSDAAKKEQSRRRKERAELGELERKARTARQ